MSKPITITIPDSLHARLQKCKEKLKVSQVCQKALDEKISDWERKTEAIQGDPEMEEIIARLRSEKAELEDQWYQKGLRAGLHIARRVSYEKLKFLATRVRTTHEEMEMGASAADEFNERESELYADTWEEYMEEPANFNNDRGEDLCPPELVTIKGKPKGPSLWYKSPVDADDEYRVATEDFYAWEDGFFESIRRFWNEIQERL